MTEKTLLEQGSCPVVFLDDGQTAAQFSLVRGVLHVAYDFHHGASGACSFSTSATSIGEALEEIAKLGEDLFGLSATISEAVGSDALRNVRPQLLSLPPSGFDLHNFISSKKYMSRRFDGDAGVATAVMLVRVAQIVRDETDAPDASFSDTAGT